MEKNIQNDHLDDYVRKSFEEYEEDPASDMWTRIEAEILPPGQISPTAPGGPSWYRYIWQFSTAAMIVLLLSTLVCERMYYENKIKQMSALQQQQPGQTEQTARTPGISDQNNSASATGTLEQTTTLPLTTKAPKVRSEIHAPASPTAHDEVTYSTFSTSTNATGIPDRNISATQAFPAASEDKKTAVSPPVTQAAVAGISTVATAVQAPAVLFQHETAAQGNDVVLQDIGDTKNVQISDFELLDHKTNLIAYPSPALFQPLIFPVNPARTPSRWYAGFHITPVLLVDKAEKRPHTMPGHRLVSNQEKASFSADYWLKAGKSIQGRWGFETGIGYRKIERNTVHSARFRLLNGRPNQGNGNQSRNYDFDYNLDSYGGSAEITLRMEQVDPSIIIPESEPVRIQVRTFEHLELLRIPALLTARFGQGRLTGLMKAGLVANMQVRNELDIIARMSESANFRPGQGANPYALNLNSSGKTFLGYQISAGWEYRPQQHLALVLEPSVAGDFARKNNAGARLPSILTVGLNAGLNYYF